MIAGLGMALAVSAVEMTAADHPSTGFVTATDSVSFTAYTCEPPGRDGLLRCAFNQTLISVKAAPEDSDTRPLRERLEEARAKAQKDKKQCAELSSQVLRPDARERLDPAPAEVAEKILEGTRALVGFLCEDKPYAASPLEALFALPRYSCNVGSNYYRMSFRRTAGGPPIWVSTAGASQDDPCGMINLTRMEHDPDFPGLWRMVSRRVVGNPGAKNALGIACSVFEQPERVHGVAGGRTTLPEFCYRFEYVPLGM